MWCIALRAIQAIYSYPSFFGPNKDLFLRSLHNIADSDQGTDLIYGFCCWFPSCCLQTLVGNNNKVLCSSFMGCWKIKTEIKTFQVSRLTFGLPATSHSL